MTDNSPDIKSAEANKKLINATNDLIFSIDRNFNITAANDAFLAMNQSAAKNPPFKIGDNFFSDLNYNDEQKSIWLHLYTKALRGESVTEEIHFEIAPYGIDIWTENTLKPISTDGIISGVVVFSKNISAQKKIEIELNNSEKRFRALFDQHAAIMLLIDPVTGKIVDVNKSTIKFYGYSYDQLCSMRAVDLSYLPAKGESSAILKIGNSQKNNLIFQHKLSDGTVRIVEIHSSYIDEPDRVLLFYIVFDITDQIKAEQNILKINEDLKIRTEELTNTNAELERFAFVASHDLQEPLRIITSFLQLLEVKFSGLVDDAGKKYIQFAVDGANRMKNLIQDLLQFARLGSGSLEITDVDMNEVLRDVMSLFHTEIIETNAAVQFAHLPVIKAGKNTMLQLMQNLIGNALKFRSEKKPEINISAEEKPTEWLFSIRDNGIGIEEKYKEKIFIIFQKLHLNTEFQGTGIGLSICQKIVERYNGKIWVESELGKGSVFKFTIPKMIVNNK